jgi:hypothetical protein
MGTVGEGTHPLGMLLLDEMSGMIGLWRHGPARASRWKAAVRAAGIVLLLTLPTAPLHAHVTLDYPNGGEMLEAGSVVQVLWHDVINHGPATYDLMYSTSGPNGPWVVIDSDLERQESSSQTYDWVVPDTPSNQVRLQVVQDNAQAVDYNDVSDADLAIVGSAAVLQVVLDAATDATIYEDGDGSLANGSGSFLFTGRSGSQNGSAERRALLAFPIAPSIPAGSTITSVRLDLMVSRTQSGEQTVGLYRLLEDWSEGPSDAPGEEGSGTPPAAGDVTWTHREFPGTLWSTPGASFAQSASATLQVAGVGNYSFSSSPELVADVQAWLDDPSSNFGWAVLLSSPPSRSAKRFNSRENSSGRPTLTVTYEAADGSDLNERYVFPASNAGGSGGSFFITTADVLNAGDTTASFRVQLLPRNTDNSNALESDLFTLEPGEVRRFDNVLGEAFGHDGEDIAGGAAVLSDSADLIVMTRTFNQVDEGTIGAALPGVPIAELVPAGQRVTVVFLTENSDFRSNLGLLSGVDFEITVEWELFDPEGNSLGTGSIDLDPYGVTQINRVMRPFRPIAGGYAEVWTDTIGGAFTTYGSILDEGTSDPTLVIPR